MAPVKTIPQVAEDPRLWEREILVKMADPVAGETYFPGPMIRMSKTPSQHTEEVISRLLGYDCATLDELRQTKAIA